MKKRRSKRDPQWEEFCRLLAHEVPTVKNMQREVERALASGEITQAELDDFHQKLWSPAPKAGTVGGDLRTWLDKRVLTTDLVARNWGCAKEALEEMLASTAPLDHANLFTVVRGLSETARVSSTDLAGALAEGRLFAQVHRDGGLVLDAARRPAPNLKPQRQGPWRAPRRMDAALAAASEGAVAEFLAQMAPEVAEAVPRNLELMLTLSCPSAIEHVRELTLQKAAEILKSLYGVEMPRAIPSEPFPLGEYLYARGEHAIFFLETRHRENYMRFSLAHGLGHLWMEQLRHLRSGKARPPVISLLCRTQGIPSASASRDYHERENAADAFAAQLLMPRAHVQRMYDEHFKDWDCRTEDVLERMCPRFRVSSWAALRRVHELRYIDDREYERVLPRILEQIRGEDPAFEVNQDM